MSDSGAGVEAYLGYLGSLREAGAEYFLEGGQAVNFWAEYIDSLSQSKPLSPMRPFTSKDCDIWVSPHTWKTLKRNPAIRQGASPADGQLGILTLSEEPPRVVDVLSSVYGIDVKENQRLLDRALDDGTVRVIDPIHLFLSKCHCLLNLPQADRQDERHVRMMSLIVPEYISVLIGDVEAEALSERALLKEIKLLKKIAATSICRRAMVKVGAGTELLIPWARIASSHSEMLAKCAQRQRPV